MPHRKHILSICLLLTTILSLAVGTYADDNSYELQESPVVITGKDIKSQEYILNVPVKKSDSKTKGDVSSLGVVVGGGGGGIPILNLEWSTFAYDPDDWWNPFDGGNRLQGITGQSIQAVNPAYESDVPAIKFQLKNTIWVNGYYRTSAPSTTVFSKFYEVNAPWVSGLSKGDTGDCNGYHKMYDSYGTLFLDTTTHYSYVIP